MSHQQVSCECTHAAPTMLHATEMLEDALQGPVPAAALKKTGGRNWRGCPVLPDAWYRVRYQAPRYVFPEDGKGIARPIEGNWTSSRLTSTSWPETSSSNAWCNLTRGRGGLPAGEKVEADDDGSDGIEWAQRHGQGWRPGCSQAPSARGTKQ